MGFMHHDWGYWGRVPGIPRGGGPLPDGHAAVLAVQCWLAGCGAAGCVGLAGGWQGTGARLRLGGGGVYVHDFLACTMYVVYGSTASTGRAVLAVHCWQYIAGRG